MSNNFLGFGAPSQCKLGAIAMSTCSLPCLPHCRLQAWLMQSRHLVKDRHPDPACCRRCCSAPEPSLVRMNELAAPRMCDRMPLLFLCQYKPMLSPQKRLAVSSLCWILKRYFNWAFHCGNLPSSIS